MPRAACAFAFAYLRTRLLQRWLTSRAAIEAWQRRKLERLRRHAIAHVAFYRELGDVPFSAFPIVDKREVMRRFKAFNCLGLTAPQAWAMLDRGEAPDGYDLGCSTGTTGNRGLYLISDVERFIWLGTIVAKALPLSPWRPHRVAIVLPRMSRLYHAANESKAIKLRFMDLRDGLPAAAAALAAFAPTVVVAPPKALRWFAENGVSIAPELMFSSAEVLDAMDRRVIERHFKQKLREIYMATEGLFAVSCAKGTLHLAEDVVHFEFEPVAGSHDLVWPIVTDFVRRTQVMARYRMNDILRLDRRRCACGSAMQPVAEIIGRADDVFRLPHCKAADLTIMVTPDVLRNAVLAADPMISDFRVRQVDRNRIEVVLPCDVRPDIGERARVAVLQACTRLEAASDVTLRQEALIAPTDTKLRRVECCWRPETS